MLLPHLSVLARMSGQTNLSSLFWLILVSFIFFPDQVSKLGKLKYKNENDSVKDVKADDLRQMFLAMTEEVMILSLS